MKHIRFFDPKTNVNFVQWFKLSWILTGALFVGCAIGLLAFGMPWGIDFLGGTEMQVKFDKPVSAGDIRDVLDNLGFDKNQVQQFGASANNEMLIRIESIAVLKDTDLARIQSLVDENFPNGPNEKHKILFDQKSSAQLSVWLNEPYDQNVSDPFVRKNLLDEQRQKLARLLDEKSGMELRKSASDTENADILSAVMADEPQNSTIRYTIHFSGNVSKIQKGLEKAFGTVEVRKVDFVDSQVSRQLRTDGLLAVIYAILAIVIYIAIRFDMFFSPGAVFSLVNDTLGAMVVFIFFRVEFDVPSIAAILTIIGYSVNNTVVIYDRIREIMPHNPKKTLSFDEVKEYVNLAINQTLSRTINSTLTTLFASIAIWIFTSGAIQNFAIVLSVGITVGAFSSVFVAPAAYLVARKLLQKSHDDEHETIDTTKLSREDRAKGVV